MQTWRPLPGPQTAALNSQAFELLYGGSAGGGKSLLLLGVARTAHNRSLLLRGTYPDLQRSLIPDSMKFYGDPRFYNGSRHMWKFPEREIEFGNLENPKDIYNYQGAAYDFLGPDELTNTLKREEYLYLFSRVRTTVEGQRCRVIACTNPGGEYEAWVKERWGPWLDDMHKDYPEKPGVLRWYKTDADGNDIETVEGDPDALSRTFIQASLKDNPFLGEDYRRTLMALPEPFRSQLLDGDWSAGQKDNAYAVFPRALVEAAMSRWVKPSGNPDELGVDLVRGGSDRMVIAPRYGRTIGELLEKQGHEIPDSDAAIAFLLTVPQTYSIANLDVAGIGSGPVDLGRKQKIPINPVNFAEKAEGTDRSGKLKFKNVRACVYWRLREFIDPEVTKEPMSLPPHPGLKADLLATRFKPDLDGIQIEKKDEIKKRLGRSPDYGDAVALSIVRMALGLGGPKAVSVGKRRLRSFEDIWNEGGDED